LKYDIFVIVYKNAFLLVFTTKEHRKRSEIPHFSEHFVFIFVPDDEVVSTHPISLLSV